MADQPAKSHKVGLSVIIPVCDEAGYIRATLESLALAREALGLEVIVSDDGSQDGTLDEVNDLADKVVRPSTGQRTGPGAARNRGAKAAQGGILVFLDADTRVRDPLGFFTLAEKAFARGGLAAATARLAVEPGQARLSERVVLLVQDLIIWTENLAGIHVAGGWCQMVDRKAFNKVNGYNEELSVSQDVDLFRRLGRLGRTRLVPGLMVFESPRRYRERGLVRTYLVRIANSLAVLMGSNPRCKPTAPHGPSFMFEGKRAEMTMRRIIARHFMQPLTGMLFLDLCRVLARNKSGWPLPGCPPWPSWPGCPAITPSIIALKKD